MKNISKISLLTLFALVLSLALASCGNNTPKEAAEEAIDSTAVVVEETAQEVKAWTFEQKDELVAELNGKLATMEAEIARLTEESKNATKEVKDANQILIKNLQDKVAAAKANIENVKKSTAENFNTFTEEMKTIFE